MHGLSDHQLVLTFLAIAVLLFAAKGMAEWARRLGQPEVLGELLGGFVIGPSALGWLFPGTYTALFLNPAVSHALSLLSWIGAILLLMIAGMEADLTILRQKVVPGLLAAAGAIGAALGIGTYIGSKYFGRDAPSAFFLGLVLSVTAVSVVAKLLIEREALRRDYAQVMLAAGIASEVLVWPAISVVSSMQHRSNPVLAALQAAGLAIGFFAFMLTFGRRFTFWAMRRVADMSAVANGELSLILLLLCVASAITAAIGLHPLLGAFVFGVLLSNAPRATEVLKERIQAITIALFAPIFFGIAGMHVNLFDLRGWQSIKGIVVVFLLAGVVKTIFGFLGARAGKLPFWEAATVGIGLNLKGGTDVVVAIVGTELLLLSPNLYTIYAVVAILTVMVSPSALTWLAAKTKPSEQELRRLNREEARRLAYLADMERVLVPQVPELLPALSSQIVNVIAGAKHGEKELFDITELSLDGEKPSAMLPNESETLADVARNLAHALVGAASSIARATDQDHVDVQHVSPAVDIFSAIEKAAVGQQLLAIGASGVSGEITVSFGALQDRVVRETSADVLITICSTPQIGPLRKILVPLNGREHSLAAADVAAYIAKGMNAEIVLFSVMAPRLGPMFWRERRHPDLLRAGYTITREAQGRISRLDVRQSEQVVVAGNPAEAVIAELKRRPYELLALGAVMRSSEQGISLGGTVEQILKAATIPRVLLVSGGAETSSPLGTVPVRSSR